jgi:hypothetical protein
MSISKPKQPKSDKVTPFLVKVQKEETDNFLNDVMKEASKLSFSSNQKQMQKFSYITVFIQSFILGAIVILITIACIYAIYSYLYK